MCWRARRSKIVSNRLSQNYNRRDILKFGGAAAVGAVLLTACGEKAPTSVGEDEATPSSSGGEIAKEIDRVVLIDGTEVDLDKVEMPDFYTDPEIEDHYRPWADPRQDLELTVEERADSVSIESDLLYGDSLDVLTDEELSTTIGHYLERIANAARDPEEYYKFKSSGTEASWEEYVKNNFIGPMVNGLFPVTYTQPELQGVKEGLVDYLADYADEYETALRRPNRRHSATVFISTTPTDISESVVPNERSLNMAIELRRPELIKDGGKGDKIVLGDMVVNIHGNPSGEYELGIQWLHLVDQPRN
jgi:hypothetical protein